MAIGHILKAGPAGLRGTAGKTRKFLFLSANSALA